ncbi:hypothetical protein SAMN05192541_1662 [Bradyrhizobium arachidis]|uniref:Uncharacterized protein n=1 Tax=Bradyrhizobium arachidis TaxID=858423 RepID=A0AAE7NWK6_9BRAD|nr:hypothetical protein WN72_44725 [Bradyrhizobium arachidis]SFV19822.1 hypothetical protein SAMN05192541_1662 [Bradyrhizobium arachidis]
MKIFSSSAGLAAGRLRFTLYPVPTEITAALKQVFQPLWDIHIRLDAAGKSGIVDGSHRFDGERVYVRRARQRGGREHWPNGPVIVIRDCTPMVVGAGQRGRKGMSFSRHLR